MNGNPVVMFPYVVRAAPVNHNSFVCQEYVFRFQGASESLSSLQRWRQRCFLIIVLIKRPSRSPNLFKFGCRTKKNNAGYSVYTQINSWLPNNKTKAWNPRLFCVGAIRVFKRLEPAIRTTFKTNNTQQRDDIARLFKRHIHIYTIKDGQNDHERIVKHIYIYTDTRPRA